MTDRCGRRRAAGRRNPDSQEKEGLAMAQKLEQEEEARRMAKEMPPPTKQRVVLGPRPPAPSAAAAAAALAPPVIVTWPKNGSGCCRLRARMSAICWSLPSIRALPVVSPARSSSPSSSMG